MFVLIAVAKRSAARIFRIGTAVVATDTNNEQIPGKNPCGLQALLWQRGAGKNK